MNRHLARLILFGVFLFFYLPILILIFYSFNASEYGAGFSGFTLRWYESLMQDYDLLEITWNSIWLALCSASLATILGTLLAFSLYRYSFRGKAMLKALVYGILMSPEIVMGIAFLILFVALGFKLGFMTLLLSHVTFCVPFVVVTVLARFDGLDENLIEASLDLGASEWQTFRRVILPLLFPAVLSGFLLAFTISLDDVIISFFVTGPDYEILPLRIYSMVRLGVKPEVNALCSILFMMTLVLVYISQKFLQEEK